MIPSRAAVAVTLSTLVSSFSAAAQNSAGSPPPVAARQPHTTSIHGYTLNDDYFWLREKTNPAVISYLGAENAYTAAMMKSTEALQQTLYDEIVGHVKQTDLSVPYRRGAYTYYSRTEAGKQYPVYLRKPVKGGAEQVLARPERIGEGVWVITRSAQGW